MGEGGSHQAADVDLAGAVGPLAGEQSLLLDEGQGGVDRGPVRLLDHRGRVRVAQRPQHRDALDGGEGEVVAGHRLGLGPRVLGDGGGQLASVSRLPAVFGSEDLPRHGGADLGPLRCRDRPVTWQAGGLVEGRHPLGGLDPERAHIVLVDLVRDAQPGRGPVLRLGGRGHPGATDPQVELPGPLVGQRVMPGAEEARHVLGRDDIAGLQAVDPGHPGADPGSGGLALLGVVARQPGVALLRGVVRGHLAGQVVIPRSGGELVQTHGHGHQGHSGAARRSLADRLDRCSFCSRGRECTRSVALRLLRLGGWYGGSSARVAAPR